MNTTMNRKLIPLALVVLALTPISRAQSQIAGDWQGTLSAGGAQLRLVLHVTAAKDGSLSSTLDSLDQGAPGIPVASTTLKDSKLSLVVDAVKGSYEGTVNKDAAEIDGTWTQSGQSLELNFKRAAVQPPVKLAAPTEIDGTWLGTLDAGSAKLHIFFKIVNTESGLTASLQSPDQSPGWVPATAVTRIGSSLTIAIKGIGAMFEGKISPDRRFISGTFTQMGKAFPLEIERVKD
jgi:hypothetical protein